MFRQEDRTEGCAGSCTLGIIALEWSRLFPRVRVGIHGRYYRGKYPVCLSSTWMYRAPDFGTQSNKCSLDITCKTVTIPDFRSECNPDETENNYESSRNHYRAQDLAFPTDHRPGTPCRPVVDCPACRRTPAGGRRTGSRQNQGNQGFVQGNRRRLPSHSVHARPAPERHHRYRGLPARGWLIPLPARPDLP